jgi:hypothetical protein
MENSQYTNEEINQLLGIKLRDVPIEEPEIDDLIFEETETQERLEQTKSQSLAKNPWAKLGLIGGGLGIFFLAIGSFLSVTGNLFDSSNIQTQATSTENKEPPTPSEGETLAALKAEAAIAGQETELGRLKEAALGDESIVNEETESPATETKLVESEPALAVATPTRPAPPRSNSVPVRRSPPPSTPSRAVTVRPSPAPVTSTAPVTPSPEVDPLERWQTLAQLGSYGGGHSSPTNEPQPTNNVNNVALANDSRITANDSRITANNRGSIIPRTQPVTGASHVVPRSQAKMVAQTTNSSNSEEEQFLLGNTAQQQITIGQTALATLETALIWESTNTSKNNDLVERFLLTLSTPLVNSQGDIILPVGTPMLVAVRSVHGSGRVSAVVETVVKDGLEISLPSGAIFLRGQGGAPLMASLIQSGQKERMAANATTFALGALSKTGELLNRGSSSTFISGGNFSQTQEFNEPNYIGGLLEGGFTPLAERMNEQHENRLSQLDNRTPLWMVNQGTTVEIFVNQSLDFNRF